VTAAPEALAVDPGRVTAARGDLEDRPLIGMSGRISAASDD